MFAVVYASSSFEVTGKQDWRAGIEMRFHGGEDTRSVVLLPVLKDHHQKAFRTIYY